MKATIVEFIEARLAEDQRIALDTDRSLVWDHGFDIALMSKYVEFDRDGPGVRVCHSFGYFNAEHVARHDPSRVLREVAFKRSFLVAYHAIDASASDSAWWFAARIEEPLYTMASAWSDHPDYRQEWHVG